MMWSNFGRNDGCTDCRLKKKGLWCQTLRFVFRIDEGCGFDNISSFTKEHIQDLVALEELAYEAVRFCERLENDTKLFEQLGPTDRNRFTTLFAAFKKFRKHEHAAMYQREFTSDCKNLVEPMEWLEQEILDLRKSRNNFENKRKLLLHMLENVSALKNSFNRSKTNTDDSCDIEEVVE